ncbi:UDP-2,3-diacylglucosamine diphosphatase [Prevotella sp. A2931]|uniref:UDP-2,3-diacylglucosamine diphosphatase n=1 Tax=Prevotella illustrans TaxID=2800387 RepID=A0ABS3M6G1_9BACT|nr:MULTISPECIES: UDP-2,3-diacylglucosamine diphosphatase [Prevotella]MBO1363750.1 UDP-2,3-diacylglucosamine diphosphatase [Prevotella illustrans]PTL27312.1 UDP-2,3-diacylglucosamine hydrolase [Prevotella sp. oral taxon 820]
MKNVYFLSDAHLGSLALKHRRTQERRLVRFLDSIKEKAAAVYLLGDMFDFWDEYKYVVPKGYTRFLGKLSELTDCGVEVHFFTGNHDLWTYGYLEQECGVIVHRKPETTEIYGKVFFLAHGDGLGDPNNRFKLLRKLFHNRMCQRLLNAVHPRWGMALGLNWAKHSRLKRADGKEPPYMGEDREFLVLFTKEYMKTHRNIDYFIYGHRHIELDIVLERQARVMILGDWIWQFTYAVFDGEHMFMEQYEEGVTKP